mgnify:CR=1 FL=1
MNKKSKKDFEDGVELHGNSSIADLLLKTLLKAVQNHFEYHLNYLADLFSRLFTFWFLNKL